MRCTRFREAISARLDGEDPGLPLELVEAHLDECADCQAWAAAVDSLGGAGADRAPVERISLDPALLATLGARAPRAQSSGGALISTFEWRIALAMIAVTQVVLSWPGAFLHDGHASMHLAHELTGWDMGLAAGFLFVAWRPARAWGMLPLVTVFVVGMVVTSGVDVASGHALLGREAVHGLAIAGLGCLWMLARRAPRPLVGVGVRLA